MPGRQTTQTKMAHDPACSEFPRRSLASLTDQEKKTLFTAAFGEPIDGQIRNDWLTPNNSIGLMGQTRQGTKILTVFADGYIHGEMSAVGAPFHAVRVVRYLDSLRIGWAGIDYPAAEPAPPGGRLC
ncbi:hypothetical protein CLV58_14126 [Spirosoma oryzae]|uniref:Uncharacterized protein n=2 Tax=Spirosoma oryzae TaxID=1469603 RepID=A0A2T0RQN0_9BACT|nr:hypothetical protein CLV58_14126 [Spirosoma oryzae]